MGQPTPFWLSQQKPIRLYVHILLRLKLTQPNHQAPSRFPNHNHNLKFDSLMESTPNQKSEIWQMEFTIHSQFLWPIVTVQLFPVLDSHLPLSAEICTLGNFSELQLSKTTSSILFTALTVANKTILLNQKFRNNINIIQCKNLLINHISLEKMSTSINNNTTDFNKIWSTLIK